MSRLRVAPIVEGEGEVNSIRILLERVWYELLEGEFIHVVGHPFVRRDRNLLARHKGKHKELIINEIEIAKAVEMAIFNLDHEPLINASDPDLVLILIDADEDCPRELGPELLKVAKETVGERNNRIEVACVIANVEYETWFVAAAESLKSILALEMDFEPIENAENRRAGKKWIQSRFLNYNEPRDQPVLTNVMDLSLCRTRSPSFDKLCRELEKSSHIIRKDQNS